MAIRMLRAEDRDGSSVVGEYVLGELNQRLASVQDELQRTYQDIEVLREELDAARARIAIA
ncbi:MAG: hypothetical protein ABR552_05950 [Actinomycetota bacterium]